MNIDFSHLPTTFDLVHIILALSCLLLLILILIKKSSVQGDLSAISTTELAKNSDEQTDDSSKPIQFKEPGPEAAFQLLTLLQQNGRFIDFIKEDLTAYSDTDVGAAARVVHEGSQKVINEYFELESIRKEEEESLISVEKGFNATEIRLTGNVIGQAPFSGTLIHKGWKISKSQLPKLAPEHDSTVIAAAEIEL